MSETTAMGKTQAQINPDAVARFREQVVAEHIRRHPRSRHLPAPKRVEPTCGGIEGAAEPEEPP